MKARGLHLQHIFNICTACQSKIILHRDDHPSGSYATSETSGDAYNIAQMPSQGEYFVSGGDRTLKIWRIDAEGRRVYGVNVGMGKLKRLINCIAVSDNDKDDFLYCGTSSGDIIKARSHRKKQFREKDLLPICGNKYLPIMFLF